MGLARGACQSSIAQCSSCLRDAAAVVVAQNYRRQLGKWASMWEVNYWAAKRVQEPRTKARSNPIQPTNTCHDEHSKQHDKERRSIYTLCPPFPTFFFYFFRYLIQLFSNSIFIQVLFILLWHILMIIYLSLTAAYFSTAVCRTVLWLWPYIYKRMPYKRREILLLYTTTSSYIEKKETGLSMDRLTWQS
jgi:hypothetical protein